MGILPVFLCKNDRSRPHSSTINTARFSGGVFDLQKHAPLGAADCIFPRFPDQVPLNHVSHVLFLWDGDDAQPLKLKVPC